MINLRAKLLAGVLLLLLPMLGLFLWGIHVDLERRRGLVLDHQLRSAQLVAALVDSVFDDAIDLGWALAQDPVVRSLDPALIDAHLQQLAPHYPQYQVLGASDALGNIVGSSVPYPPGEQRTSIEQLTYFQQTMASGQPVVSEVYQSVRWPGKPLTVIAVPILADGRSFGTVLVVFVLHYFPARLSLPEVWPGDAFSVVDPHGRIAFASRVPDLAWEQRDKSQVPEVQAALKGRTVQTDNYRSPVVGDLRAAAFVRSARYGWVVVASAPQAAVLAPVQDAARRELTVFALIAVLGFAGAWGLSRYLTGSLSQLVVMTQALGQGKLNQRVDITTGDELERLGHAFNAMAEQLEANLAQIEAQRHRLLTVLKHIPEGVIMVDAPSGRLSLWNHAAETLLGHIWEGDDLDAWRGVLVTHPDGRPFPFEEWPLVRSLRTGQPVLGVELAVPGRAGGRMILLVNAAPVLQDGGRFVAAMMTFQDITDRKSMERLKDEFLSLAAHELKTPITTIKGNSQLLLRRSARGESALQKEDTRLLQTIDERVDYVTGLVNELLDLTRIESGHLRLHPQPMDMAALLQKVVAEQGQLHPNRAISLRGADQPVQGTWDRERLEQVFINLLDNALKYSPSGRPILVQLASSGGDVEVTVQDRGIGIPERDLPHLFERHFRGSNVGLSPSGLGLGLYLSNQIVQWHRGSMCAESAEGEGTTFYVVLPVG